MDRKYHNQRLNNVAIIIIKIRKKYDKWVWNKSCSSIYYKIGYKYTQNDKKINEIEVDITYFVCLI